MAKSSSGKLTTPDLVMLSLLAEEPMYGYQANALLESRNVRAWAGVSRPQVYYSLEKLSRLGLLAVTADENDEPAGPERRVFATTKRGRASLATALERADWTQQIERPAFLTWLALSWQCRSDVFLRQLKRRREFLEGTLQLRQATLQDVQAEVGHPFHEAVWMLSLVIEEIKTELAWLGQIEREWPSRAPAGGPHVDPVGRRRLNRLPTRGARSASR
jgi:DNA-binding PadR family transcriptional regulator